jgi:hypothetical protein
MHACMRIHNMHTCAKTMDTPKKVHAYMHTQIYMTCPPAVNIQPCQRRHHVDQDTYIRTHTFTVKTCVQQNCGCPMGKTSIHSCMHACMRAYLCICTCMRPHTHAHNMPAHIRDTAMSHKASSASTFLHVYIHAYNRIAYKNKRHRGLHMLTHTRTLPCSRHVCVYVYMRLACKETAECMWAHASSAVVCTGAHVSPTLP